MLNISNRKIGGIRFIRCGRLCLSFYVTRRRATREPSPVREYVFVATVALAGICLALS
jgi:hypothetical protein